MLALTLALSVQLGAGDLRPEAWVVVSRRSGVGKPAALDLAAATSAALGAHEVPAALAPEDATACAGKAPCLIDLARQKGVSVLVTLEAGAALDDVVVHLEAYDVDEFGKRLATYDYSGPVKQFKDTATRELAQTFAPRLRLAMFSVAPAPAPPPPTPAVTAAAPDAPQAEPAPVAAAAAPVTIELTSSAPWSLFKIVGVAGMGGGAVLLVSSLVLAIRTLNLVGGLDATCARGQSCHDDSAYALYSQAGASQNAAVSLAVAGLLTAAAGAVLFVLNPGAATAGSGAGLSW